MACRFPVLDANALQAMKFPYVLTLERASASLGPLASSTIVASISLLFEVNVTGALIPLAVPRRVMRVTSDQLTQNLVKFFPPSRNPTPRPLQSPTSRPASTSPLAPYSLQDLFTEVSQAYIHGHDSPRSECPKCEALAEALFILQNGMRSLDDREGSANSMYKVAARVGETCFQYHPFLCRTSPETILTDHSQAGGDTPHTDFRVFPTFEPSTPPKHPTPCGYRGQSLTYRGSGGPSKSVDHTHKQPPRKLSLGKVFV